MLRSQRSLRLGIRWLVVSGLGLHTLYPIPCTIIIHNLYISNCYQHGQKCGPGVRLVPSNKTQFFAIKLTDLLGKPNGPTPLSSQQRAHSSSRITLKSIHWQFGDFLLPSSFIKFIIFIQIYFTIYHVFISPCFTLPLQTCCFEPRQQHLFWPCRHWSPSWTSCHPDPAPKKTCLADETVHSTEKDVGKP